MNGIPKVIKYMAIFITTLVFFLLAQIPLRSLGWAPDSTPQAYLPLVLYLSTPTPEITPTATSSPTPTNTSTPPADWLSYVNWLRSLGGLPGVKENSSWSYGDTKHSIYVVKNDYLGHDEDPSNPWYTQEGADAAAASNVMASFYLDTPDLYAIDMWMTGPFHGVGIIDPALGETGFGSFRADDGGYTMAAALDVIRGLGSIPPAITFPIMWPSDGGIMPYIAYNGGEAPDPLSGCSGYTVPSGPPIFLMIGDGSQVPNVTAHSFRQAGSELAHCVFDETSYTNPNGSYQSLGRTVLSMRDAIIVMPRDPLVSGLTYTVSITNSGTTYSWSLIVSGSYILFRPNIKIW
jgi:uncharacterized protein YkwD